MSEKQKLIQQMQSEFIRIAQLLAQLEKALPEYVTSKKAA